MRIGIDARPLMGRRTGIGKFLEGLLNAVAVTWFSIVFAAVAVRPSVFAVAGSSSITAVRTRRRRQRSTSLSNGTRLSRDVPEARIREHEYEARLRCLGIASECARPLRRAGPRQGVDTRPCRGRGS